MSAQGLADCRKMMTMAKARQVQRLPAGRHGLPGRCIAGAGTLADPAKSAAMLTKYKAEAKMKNSTETPYPGFHQPAEVLML